MIFASNLEICRRAGGIDERTLRRHVKRLVEAGILVRQDSPNRKRYRVSAPTGAADATFGLDLSPMRQNAPRFAATARAVEEEARLCRYLRKKLLAVLYRIEEACGVLAETAEIRKRLRCKIDSQDYQNTLYSAVEIEANLTTLPATDLSANDGQTVRHLSKSEKEDMDLEKADPAAPSHEETLTSTSGIMLAKVLRGCREAISFCSEVPRSWADVVRLAETLAPMIGIDQELLSTASAKSGRERTSLAVLLVLEMGSKVRNQRAYFTSLVLGPRAERFDPGAVLNRMLAPSSS